MKKFVDIVKCRDIIKIHKKILSEKVPEKKEPSSKQALFLRLLCSYRTLEGEVLDNIIQHCHLLTRTNMRKHKKLNIEKSWSLKLFEKHMICEEYNLTGRAKKTL